MVRAVLLETRPRASLGGRRMLAERLDRSQRSEASPSTDDIKLRGFLSPPASDECGEQPKWRLGGGGTATIIA